MSANTEFVREWVAAWNRRDIDALMEAIGPDFEWVVAREHPDATTHRGVEAGAAYLRDWMQTMPDLRIEIEELSEIGDQVLLIMRMKGTGAESGASTEVRTATVNTFRDGRPVRTKEFLDPEEARRAVAG